MVWVVIVHLACVAVFLGFASQAPVLEDDGTSD